MGDNTISKKSAPNQTQVRNAKIDPDRARFPSCIVWTPLPLISWILPFIGHTGIGMSDGVIHDFAGPYTITVDDLAFGETHKQIKYSQLFRYVRLDIDDNIKYDRAVEKADQIYEQMMHNLFWQFQIILTPILATIVIHMQQEYSINVTTRAEATIL